MGDYDRAERYAIKRIDPPGFLRWLLVGLDPDLAFSRWLETQLAPFPGEPDRRPDCVAEFVSSSGTRPPWACLVEPQGQEQADFLARVVQYLMMLRTDLRTGWRDQDRYLMMAGIVNVCEGTLQSAIDWRPPGAVGVGLTAGVWVRNVYDEPAAWTLDEIAAGRVERCLLPWVPLMDGGDRPDVLARWRVLAEQEADRQLRSVFGGMALVFAEKRKRGAVWRKGLEGWNVQESQIVNEWRADAVLNAMRELVLTLMEEKFRGSVPAEITHRVESEGNRDTLTRWVRLMMIATPEELRAAVLASPNGSA